MEKLTIQLDHIESNRLEEISVGPLNDESARLDSLALHPKHDNHDRNTHSNKDDGESAKRPPEVQVGVEQVGNPGASKGARNSRCAVEAKHDHAVAEGRHIGEEHVNDIHHADVAGPVKSVGADVRLHVLACGLHDETDEDEGEHGDEALDAAPDVDDLGEGETRAAADDGGDDADGGEEAVLAELGRDVGAQGALDGEGEHVDERDEVEPGDSAC